MASKQTAAWSQTQPPQLQVLAVYVSACLVLTRNRSDRSPAVPAARQNGRSPVVSRKAHTQHERPHRVTGRKKIPNH